MKSKVWGWLAVGLLTGPLVANAGFVSYTVSVTDEGDPSTFGFSFATPITPIAGLASFSFTGDFTLTDGRTDGVSVANSGLRPEYWRISTGNPLASVGDVGGVATLVGTGPHSFTASGTFDCASIGQCNFLQLEVYFTASGGGDRVLSTGRLDLDPLLVPEPGSLALVALGLAGLGRRRKAA
jgi:hypothetical protein